MGVYVFRFLLLVLGWSIPCIPIDIFLLFANKEKKNEGLCGIAPVFGFNGKSFREAFENTT